MGLVETEAIVLKSFNLDEADKIVHLITRSDGVIKGVAKGSRRLKSRFGSILEPFTLVKLDFFQREERELVSIREVEIKESYFEKASDPHFLQLYSYMAELLLEFSPPHEKNDDLFRMTRACFSAVSGNQASADSIQIYFEMWLLRLAGFLPDWDKCVVCDRRLEVSEVTMLQMNSQLGCLNCVSPRKGSAVTADARQIYYNARRKTPLEFSPLVQEKYDEIELISSINQKLIRQIVGHELSSQKFPAIQAFPK